MISAQNQTKLAIEQQTALTIQQHVYLEYNINEMMNLSSSSIKLKDKTSGDEITNTDNAYSIINGYRYFKTYFPHTSIINLDRPQHAGIRYDILGEKTSKYIDSPQNVLYKYDYRTYVCGTDTTYKYYLSNKNEGMRIALEYPKTAFINKLIVKFEISHGVPISGKIRLKVSGSYTQVATFQASDISTFSGTNPGTLTLYYNGTSWNTTESQLSYSQYVQATGVELEVDAFPVENANKYIGLIEISPRYAVDITSDIASFSINRDSSVAQEVVPVGSITANSVNLNMVRFAQSNTYDGKLRYIEYDKTHTNFSSSVNLIYLYKDVMIKPYIVINGESIPQGIFYLSEWTLDEFGNLSMSGFDGAKVLQKTLCPEIMCENYSTTAILRRLLDSVGFPNYKINISSADVTSQVGITKPYYWWTDPTMTVWDAIQELCTDNQINAFFDEKNVLQFYTRDNFYNSSKTADWGFRYTTNTYDNVTKLSNIINFVKQKKQAGTALTVNWSPIVNTDKSLDMSPLYTAPDAELMAFALEKDILATDTAGSYITGKVLSGYNGSTTRPRDFSGYILIDSEIIEYDAIQYKYSEVSNPVAADWKYVDITSSSDISKYQVLVAQPYSENFVDTGKIRIKTRGAFGTNGDISHSSADDVTGNWNLRKVTWT